MEITEVKVFPVGEDKLKAFVSVVIDQCFMVNDIKIIQGRQGLFISMPSRKKKNGEFKDVAHPLNNDTRRMIESKVLSEYDRVLEERGETCGAEVKARSQGAPAKPKARPMRPPQPVEPAAARSESPEGSQAQTSPQSRDTAEPSATPEEAAPKKEKETEDEGSGKSLEEVEEMHLRDSFWTVP
jgi:stage V sporulation protein G